MATTTEIYDYLRLLYARCGAAFSWAPTKLKKDGTILERRGTPISATSATQITDSIMGWARDEAEEKTRIMVLAPVVRGKKGFHKDVLEKAQGDGWQRVRVNGGVVDLRDALKEGGENPLGLGRYEKHTIEIVVDRIVLREDVRQRVSEAVEAALRDADGAVVVARQGSRDRWVDHAFNAKLADPEAPEYALEELSPRLFSFNSPFGACPTCHGLGNLMEFDEELVVPDQDKTLLKGGIAPWKKNGPGGMIYPKTVRRFCRAFGVNGNTPMGELDADIARILLHGTTSKDESTYGAAWAGVLKMLDAWFKKTESEWVKDHLHQYMSAKVCPDCHGDRLRIEALHVQLLSAHSPDMSRATSGSVIGRPRQDGRMLSIAELSRLSINDAIDFIDGLMLSDEQTHIAEPILREVGNRLRFLTSVGLEYLSLDRRTATLSGGEAQRIRLATQVGSGLVGACYVLDEPTIGLHQRDNARLIATLRHLTDIGNTVLVVEHDEEMNPQRRPRA